MVKVIKIGLWITGTMIFSVWSQDITGSGGRFHIQITKHYQVNKGGKLLIQGVNGEISVASWQKAEVEITERATLSVFTRNEAEAIAKRIENAYQQQGNSIILRGENISQARARQFTIFVPVEFNLDIATIGGDVSIRSFIGDVHVRTSGGDILMENVAGTIHVTTSGGDLTFHQLSGQVRAVTSGGDVVLQKMVGEADITTSGGDISVDHASNRISVSTSGGDIALNRLEGSVTARTSGGSIRLSAFSGDKAILNTSGGDLQLETCNGNVVAVTAGGDVTGRHLQGASVVRTSGGTIKLTDVAAETEAQTLGGDIEIEVTLTDFKKPHGIKAETKGGDVTIVLPAKIPATIQAEVRLSRRDWLGKRYDIYSDFPLTKSTTDETEGRILHSTGEINGGGDLIVLKTSGGDIFIKKGK